MIHLVIVTSLGLFGGTLALVECGRRVGVRVRRRAGDADISFATLEAAAFALMGLLIAFTFSSAASRYDNRRRLVVEEANAIGTAWLRIDLLPEVHQPALRDGFRAYLDSRLAYYRDITSRESASRATNASEVLQRQIWSQAVAACRESSAPSTPILVLPSLNAVFDIRATRIAAANTHLPSEIGLVLVITPLLCSFIAGLNIAARPNRSWLQMIAFAAILAFTVFVVFDLEYPRVGFIRLDRFDQLLVDLRTTMQSSF